jgi:hypothetical protein
MIIEPLKEQQHKIQEEETNRKINFESRINQIENILAE